MTQTYSFSIILGWSRWESRKTYSAWKKIHQICQRRVWRSDLLYTSGFLGVCRWTRAKTKIEGIKEWEQVPNWLNIDFPNSQRKVMTSQEISQLKDHTPDLKHGSVLLFRSLRDKGKLYFIFNDTSNHCQLSILGIISFTEYLFLLSVLTSKKLKTTIWQLTLTPLVRILEPQSGFRIAFNMFDADGNQRVDKDEFLVVSIW